MKGEFGAFFDLVAALSLFFSAAAAFLSKRNSRELHAQTPRRKRRERGRKAADSQYVNGITVKDALVSVLEEINNLHLRLDKANVAKLERTDDDS
jgi:hypothetical protein